MTTTERAAASDVSFPLCSFLPFQTASETCGLGFSMQICDNLSVSAAPSQHPYPFCPFGTFPPDRGNRPLKMRINSRNRKKDDKRRKKRDSKV